MNGEPNMFPEVAEAIEAYFKEYPEVETDCLLYLASLYNNKTMVGQLSAHAVEKLLDKGLCPKCGSKLEYYHYQEPHDELEGCPMEDFYEPYCPVCDFRKD